MRRNFFIFFLLIGAIFLSCSDNPGKNSKIEASAFDLDSIIARRKLIAVTDFNSTNYFVYNGEPMGFHYDLLKAFTEHLGIDLEIVSENDIKDAFGLLNSGKVDILAMSLAVTDSRKSEIAFSSTIDSTRLVLVQRKPGKWETMSSKSIEAKLLRKHTDLADKAIYVQKGSSHAGLLNQISMEIGQPVTVMEVPFEAEALIQLVDKGEIGYAVCDENIAEANAVNFPGIDFKTPLSTRQSLAWGLRLRNSEKLQKELNTWIVNFRKTQAFAILYSKYFRNSKSPSMVKSEYFSLNSGKVSQWDDLIKIYSATIRWDWRLLASLIYQESRFIPDVKSKMGAYGLMQIMPQTGRNFGIDITLSPSSNLKAGTEYINWLYNIFVKKVPDEGERTKFILASYNAGPGHVIDAMNLAGKNGMDPLKWDNNVEVWLQKKSEPLYYNDTVVKYGYFRGKESVAFVNQVLDRYNHYKNIVP